MIFLNSLSLSGPGVTLTLCSFVVNSTRQFILSLALHCVFVFFSPFSFVITSLGKERVGLCAFPGFVCFGPVVCVFFLFLLVSGTGCDL